MSSIIITGAASGIGRATAELFYKKGWTVGLADMDETGLKKVQNTMDKKRSCILPMNVTDSKSVEKALRDFEAFQGNSLDVLFNCAGILQMGNNETIPLKDQHKIFDINVGGILNCIHYALPALKQSTVFNSGAHIISMSSASAVYGTPQLAAYSASKHAVRALTESLNIELEPQGIIVSDIMVPYVKTPMVQDAKQQAASIEKNGVKVTPEEVAQAVWKAAHGNRVHWQVSPSMYLLSIINWALPFNRKRLFKLLTN